MLAVAIALGHVEEKSSYGLVPVVTILAKVALDFSEWAFRSRKEEDNYMKRRGFLGMLGAAIAGATLDPERLLWEPGKRLISIPTPRLVKVIRRAVSLRGGRFQYANLDGGDLGRGSYDTFSYEILELGMDEPLREDDRLILNGVPARA